MEPAAPPLTSDGQPSSLLVPAGTRLVHIGPPKTGTTAVQSAFHSGRTEIARQGVHYAGPTHQPSSAVRAVIGRPNPMTGKTPSMWLWRTLMREIRSASEARVVVSSEFLSDAPPDIVRRIVGDLDRERVHVVVTLRPLASLLPSQWQQYVQTGLRVPYESWLKVVLGPSPGKLTPGFWHRHRHDRLIARWADVVGPERITAVVLDERDRSMVLRTFEELTGLRPGTLVADATLANRSMTLPEIELVRAFNVLARAEGVERAVRTRVMTYGATSSIQARTPGPDEPGVSTPVWATARAVEVAREIVDGIANAGVRVVGELEGLTATAADPGPGSSPARVVVPPDLAAAAAMGVLIATGMARGHAAENGMPGDPPDGLDGEGDRPAPRRAAEPFDLMRVPTAQIAEVLARRVIRDGRARVAGLVRRSR